MHKNYILLFIKIAVSGGLLTLIINGVDLDRLWALLKNAEPVWVVLSTAIMIARNWVGAWRCQVLMRSKDLDAAFGYLTALYFIGQFFHFFLPTSLGGDVARAYYLGRKTGQTIHAIAIVAMERITGFASLTALVLISLPICFVLFGIPDVLYVAVALNLVVFLGIVAALHPITHRAFSAIRIPIFAAGLKKIQSTLDSVRQFDDRSKLWLPFVLSGVFQFAAIFATYLLAESLGQEIPFLYFLLLIPLVYTISMVPFTLNGLGVREGAFVYLFGLIGVNPQVALGIAFLFFVQLVILSIIGGLVYSQHGFSKPEPSLGSG